VTAQAPSWKQRRISIKKTIITFRFVVLVFVLPTPAASIPAYTAFDSYRTFR
jgi:hypothetical protein